MEPVAALLSAITAIADLHAPEVMLVDDRDLSFDWMHSRGVVLTVALRPDGRYVWAALIHDWKDSGTGILPHITSTFREAIERYDHAAR